jgi:hypothetical protein
MRRFVISIIDKCDDASLACFFPILVHSIRYDLHPLESPVLEMLLRRSQRSSLLMHQLYWELQTAASASKDVDSLLYQAILNELEQHIGLHLLILYPSSHRVRTRADEVIRVLSSIPAAHQSNIFLVLQGRRCPVVSCQIL